MEYSFLFDQAANEPNTIDKLAYIAAYLFAILSQNINRTKKFFNPLLGETYEYLYEEGN